MRSLIADALLLAIEVVGANVFLKPALKKFLLRSFGEILHVLTNIDSNTWNSW